MVTRDGAFIHGLFVRCLIVHHENMPIKFDPLYIVKLGLTAVYTIFFLISVENIDCLYSLKPPW